MQRHYYVYMMASLTRVLYVGVTNDIARRVSEHKSGMIEGFTKRYRCHHLVWYAETPDVEGAIAYEKTLKGWKREKKCALVNTNNPDWRDLSDHWYRQGAAAD